MNPEFERSDIRGGFVVWSYQGKAVVIEAPDPGWSARLMAAYERRVEAQLIGRCACGAELDDVQGVAPRQARATMIHENDCDASDERMGELLRNELVGGPADPRLKGADTIRPKRKRHH